MGPSHQEGLTLALFDVQQADYPRLRLQDRVQPHWVVSHVLRGAVRTSAGGETHAARAGDVMVHPPHLPFSEEADGPGTHQYLILDLRTAGALDLLRQHPVSPVVPLLHPPDFADTFGQLARAWAAPASPARDLRVFALTTDLLAQVLDGWEAMGRPTRPPAWQTPEDRFADVLAFMTAHLDRRLTRDDLAGRLCLHPGYFDRVFRAAYGVAPMRMLRDLRLERARQLLETTDDTLESIAQACGLGDGAAFSRAFRARYGLAPGRHRESVKATRTSYLPP